MDRQTFSKQLDRIENLYRAIPRIARAVRRELEVQPSAAAPPPAPAAASSAAPAGPKKPKSAMEKATKRATGHGHSIELLEKHAPMDDIRTVLDVGGSRGNNLMMFLEKKKGYLAEKFDYHNLDIAPPKEPSVPTIRGDITKRTEISAGSIDFVFCGRTLEHVTQPWKAAEEISRIVRPGGFVYVSVPFAWRYHPVPIDYWRFSPACLQYLFDDFEPIEVNFTSAFRRRDIRGFWKTRKDAVPVDELGGFRENWESFFFGRKKTDSPR